MGPGPQIQQTQMRTCVTVNQSVGRTRCGKASEMKSTARGNKTVAAPVHQAVSVLHKDIDDIIGKDTPYDELLKQLERAFAEIETLRHEREGQEVRLNSMQEEHIRELHRVTEAARLEFRKQRDAATQDLEKLYEKKLQESEKSLQAARLNSEALAAEVEELRRSKEAACGQVALIHKWRAHSNHV